MIDSDGFLRCDNVNCSPKGDRKKLGMHFWGHIEIPCPRCHYFNIFDVAKGEYQSHKVLSLQNLTKDI